MARPLLPDTSLTKVYCVGPMVSASASRPTFAERRGLVSFVFQCVLEFRPSLLHLLSQVFAAAANTAALAADAGVVPAIRIERCASFDAVMAMIAPC